ncbi:UNVERIFIED_CONTAM: hypothetical protein K2H54_003067, partial [Gekko kuhli]
TQPERGPLERPREALLEGLPPEHAQPAPFAGRQLLPQRLLRRAPPVDTGDREVGQERGRPGELLERNPRGWEFAAKEFHSNRLLLHPEAEERRCRIPAAVGR